MKGNEMRKFLISGTILFLCSCANTNFKGQVEEMKYYLNGFNSVKEVSSCKELKTRYIDGYNWNELIELENQISAYSQTNWSDKGTASKVMEIINRYEKVSSASLEASDYNKFNKVKKDYQYCISWGSINPGKEEFKLNPKSSLEHKSELVYSRIEMLLQKSDEILHPEKYAERNKKVKEAIELQIEMLSNPNGEIARKVKGEPTLEQSLNRINCLATGSKEYCDKY